MKVGEHFSFWHFVFTVWIFDNIENKHGVYEVENCLRKFRDFYREKMFTVT